MSETREVPQWIREAVAESVVMRRQKRRVTVACLHVLDALRAAGYPVYKVETTDRLIPGGTIYTVHRTARQLPADEVGPTFQRAADELSCCLSLGHGGLWSFDLVVWRVGKTPTRGERYYRPGGNGRMVTSDGH